MSHGVAAPRLQVTTLRAPEADDDPAWVSWGIWAVDAALALFAVGFLVASITAEVPARPAPRGAAILLALAFATVGARIASRHPRNPVGWLLSLMGSGFAVQALAEEQVLYAMYVRGASLEAESAVLRLWSAAGHAVVLAGGFVLLVFPDRRPRGAELVIGAALGATSAGLVAYVLTGGPLVASPTGPFAALHRMAAGQPFYATLEIARALTLALAAATLGRAAVHGDGEQRRRIRWVAGAASLAAIVYVLTVLIEGATLLEMLEFPSLLLVPLAIGAAMHRYRLYDVDVLLSHALVYGTASAILAGLVFATSGWIQRSFLALTGASSEVALTLSTLILVAAFTPLKDALQRLLDRRIKPSSARFGLDAFDRALQVELVVRDPSRVLSQLLEESLAEFGISSGYVEIVSGDRVWRHAAGRIGTEEKVRLAVHDDLGPLQVTLVLGPRLNGAPYHERHVERLRHLLAVAAEVVGRAGSRPMPVGASAPCARPELRATCRALLRARTCAPPGTCAGRRRG